MHDGINCRTHFEIRRSLGSLVSPVIARCMHFPLTFSQVNFNQLAITSFCASSVHHSRLKVSSFN